MNRTVDSPSDLYSLGVTFHEMLAGRRPFESSDALGRGHHHIARAPRPLHEVAAVPRPLSALVLRRLEKMAEDRYSNDASPWARRATWRHASANAWLSSRRRSASGPAAFPWRTREASIP